MKLVSFVIGISYSTAYIYDCTQEGEYHLLDDIDTYCGQGFKWQPGCLTLFAIHGSGYWNFEVFLEERVQPSTNAARTIQMPYVVSDDRGLTVEEGGGGNTYMDIIKIPVGYYSLIVEQGFNGQSQTDEEKDELGIWCRLWFTQADNVEPKILVQDAELNPHYPLKLDGLNTDK
ncbi:hypothetical protein [Methyloglobulus sp.]|uniref:hypothetical protein n=1 Tax=Methyloglobulus sp. TaxID=2518622 RepID=UPI0032B739DC